MRFKPNGASDVLKARRRILAVLKIDISIRIGSLITFRFPFVKDSSVGIPRIGGSVRRC